MIFVLSSLVALAKKPVDTRAIDVPPPAPVDVAKLGVTTYKAVLFSAQDYADSSGIHDLGTPNRDIAELGKVLEQQYGFQVTLVPDATEADIIGKLDALKAQSGPDDAVIVYFAGHGLYDEVEKRGFWLPTDAALDNTARWVSNDDVTAKLRAIPARHVLVIIDACFSGMFRDVNPAWPVDPRQLAAVQSLASKRSRAVISSGSNEPVSDGGRDGMSVFAYYLREGLRSARDPFVLPAESLFPELRERVSQNSPQTPQQGIFHAAYHEGGELVLVNKSAEAAPVAASTAPSASDAEAKCARESAAMPDVSSRDAYAALGVGGWSSPAEQVQALSALPTDPKRLLYYTCLDYERGQIGADEYARWKALLTGDAAAKQRLAQDALAAQRKETREVPPPSTCDARPDEAELLVRANGLLRDGTSGSKRPEDTRARALVEPAAKGGSAALWATVARARLYAGATAAEVTAAADQAAKLCPTWGVPDAYRGSAWVLASDYGKATAAFQEAVKKSPDYAFAYYNLAVGELVQKQLDAALGHLDQALKLDPTLGEAYWMRGRVLAMRKDFASATVALQSAVDLRPRTEAIVRTLGDVYAAAGDAAKAAEMRTLAEEL